MANETTLSHSTSRLIRLAMFAASIGVVLAVYVLRRRPKPQAESVTFSNSVPVLDSASQRQLPPEPVTKKTPLSQRQQLTLVLLTLAFGGLLFVLYNLDSRVSFALLIMTIVGLIGAFVYNVLYKRSALQHILSDLVKLPFRFYAADAPASNQPVMGTKTDYWASAFFSGGMIGALVFLPILPFISLIFVTSVIGVVTYGWLTASDVFIIERRVLIFLKAPSVVEAVSLPHISRRMLLAEIIVILVTTFATTRPFYDSPPNWQFSGNEGEWLTSTVYAAYTGLQNDGRIPRWQPYIAHGEPTIENPFNFIFNPFASGPSLILGPQEGLRISIIVCYFLAGLGGWFLGRVIGLGTLGRLLLAAILMGKGNIHTMLNSGYYQLALSQIYMPWVIGGVIAIMRFPKRRWPLVLTALALTLQLLNGNLWYVLPTALGALITALVCVFVIHRPRVDWSLFGRYATTALMTIGLSAVIAVPILLEYDHVGRHEDELQAGWVTPLTDILPLFFDSDRYRTVTFFEPSRGRTAFHYIDDLDEFYFSYIIPAWYMLLIFVALPFYRPMNKRDRMIALVVIGLFIFATLWGAGGQQPLLWLYEHIPPLRQWRFVPRALAVASFWLALLVAMRLDHLWNAVRIASWERLFTVKLPPFFLRVIPVALSTILVGATVVAAADVNDQWHRYDSIMRPIDPAVDGCTTWLRQQYPDAQLSVWEQDYVNITTFLNNRVRSANISADFEMLPQATTIGPNWLDLNSIRPDFGEFGNKDQPSWGRDYGYWLMLDSPLMVDGIHCLSRRTHQSLPYAYSIPLPYLTGLVPPPYDREVDLISFSPIRMVERRDDQIALIATPKPNMPLVVGVQESAYPGWRVELDGEPARLESVGNQIGVVIPAGNQPVQVYFVYAPVKPVIGGLITLVSAVLCMLYLLQPRRNGSRLLASMKR